MAKSRAAKLGCLVAITGALSLMPGVIEEASASSTTITFEVAEYSTKTVPFWQGVVKTFEANGMMLERKRHRVGCQKRIGKT